MTCLFVRDHGLGIPEAYEDKIFERFFQIDSSDSRQKGGTGLGLSIVRKLVEKMNGEIGHEPTPTGGTTFHVMLPRHVGGTRHKSSQSVA